MSETIPYMAPWRVRPLPLLRSLGLLRCVAWCLLALVLSAGAARADDRLGESRDQDRALRARSHGDVQPLESVIGSARSKGKVLDVQISGGKYKMKVLDPDGHVRSVDVDGSGSRGSGSSGSSGGSGSNSSGGDSHEGSGGRGRGRGR